jgi:hypothetical protein
VAMVAVEAALPQLTHIGAVYTVGAYRNRGLAKGVVPPAALHRASPAEIRVETAKIYSAASRRNSAPPSVGCGERATASF